MSSKQLGGTVIRHASFLGVCIVAVMCSYAAGGGTEAAASTLPPRAVLAKIRLGNNHWEIVASRDASNRTRPCIAIGVGVGRRHYAFVSSELSCGLPTYSESEGVHGAGGPSVLALAFPQNVVRVHLNLGMLGQRNVSLRLLTQQQSDSARVEPFRWTYLKLFGESCLQEVIGYDAEGQIVSNTNQDPGGSCNPMFAT